ncbi:hypothetical protein WOLCODRAFT_157956 [Wolfiporia cocos MD-104 SS10]|uniref:Uncharacterized protein n=1 Tax=Wolfiporia cocos (strain MD-104) TaxID=742152 RepID=A0A2H3J5M0_WOLCO|nr:hypothetical protein WOLCODRAFT_157956 [Wolfiporia cocos MD-104 SS10]
MPSQERQLVIWSRMRAVPFLPCAVCISSDFSALFALLRRRRYSGPQECAYRDSTTVVSSPRGPGGTQEIPGNGHIRTPLQSAASTPDVYSESMRLYVKSPADRALEIDGRRRKTGVIGRLGDQGSSTPEEASQNDMHVDNVTAQQIQRLVAEYKVTIGDHQGAAGRAGRAQQ